MFYFKIAFLNERSADEAFLLRGRLGNSSSIQDFKFGDILAEIGSLIQKNNLKPS